MKKIFSILVLLCLFITPAYALTRITLPLVASTVGETYYLGADTSNANTTTNLIHITASNVTIDGQYNSITDTGTAAYRILIDAGKTNVTIKNLTLSTAYSYGVRILGSNTRIENCQFTHTSSGASAISVRASTYLENVKVNSSGGQAAVSVSNGAITLSIINCTLKAAGAAGYAITTDQDDANGCTMLLYNSILESTGQRIFYNDNSPVWSGLIHENNRYHRTDATTSIISYSGVSTYTEATISSFETSGSAGSISFTNEGANDLTLLSTSFCLDAGDSSKTSMVTDVLGNDRILGSNIDLGAYEFQGTVTNGACCYADGTCTIRTEAWCDYYSRYTYKGDFTTCSEELCYPVSGSCCTPEGTCTVTWELYCSNTWTSEGVCIPNTCTQPSGSCCAFDGSCTLTLEANCTSPSTWTMFGLCSPNICVPLDGSCCQYDGTCAITTSTNCSATWTLGGICDPNTCVQPPTGSCCSYIGDCTVTTEANCTGTSIWTLDGTCDPNICEPLGSCCTASGSCAVTSEALCSNTWSLGGVCIPNTCVHTDTEVDLTLLPDHPRLFLRDSMLDSLRAEREPGEPKYDMYREIKRRALGYSDDTPATSGYGSVIATLNLALVGILESDSSYIDTAIDMLMFKQRHGGWAWETVSYSLAYDWLYNYMSDAQADTLRSYFYSKFYAGVGGQRTVFYNLEANEAYYKGLAGLACYGDANRLSTDPSIETMDLRFKSIVENMDGRMRGVREFAVGGSAVSKGGVLPSRQFYFPDGGYYKGNHYGQKDLGGIIPYLYLMEDLGLGSYWDLCDSFLDNTPEYYMRIKRPDGLCARIMAGNAFGWDLRGQEGISMLASRHNSDNQLATSVINTWSFPYSGAGGSEWYLLYVLMHPGSETTAISSLPLYKFYGSNGTKPNTDTSWHERVVTRTDWNQSTSAANYQNYNDVFFQLTAGNYFGDYYNYFEPTFEIYYKGALAIKSGFYPSGNPHSRNYYHNSVSCNTVVVFDSTLYRPAAEGLPTYHDKWGQDRLYADSYGAPGAPVNIYDIRDNQSSYGNADISIFDKLSNGLDGEERYYAKATLNPSTAFPYTNDTRKVEKLEREFFWTGKNFIVADVVSIDPSVVAPKKIRWLLHTIEQPTMTSSLQYSSVVDHIDVYSQGSYSSIRNNLSYTGKITVTPLLPSGSILRRVGGTGYEYWADSSWTSGANYSSTAILSSYTNSTIETGAWRVETIAPGSPDSVDFLHTIYVGDSGDTPPTYITLTGANMVGCEMSGVGVIVFNRGDGSSLSYLPTSGTVIVPQVILGLNLNSDYEITETGVSPYILTTTSGGSLNFDRSGTTGTIYVVETNLPTSGSCCEPNGSCTVTSEVNCSATWLNGGTCTPNICIQPNGSCCAHDGTCTVTTEANCSDTWTIYGTCTPNICTQPSGSCCEPNGSCTITTEANCSDTWTIDGVCSPNTCPSENIPAQVTTLLVKPKSSTSVTIYWTAVGNNEHIGTASAYSLRYSVSPITEGNFSSASQVNGLSTPKASGQKEKIILTNMSRNTKYYFALKVQNSDGNWSVISNTPSITTRSVIIISW